MPEVPRDPVGEFRAAESCPTQAGSQDEACWLQSGGQFRNVRSDAPSVLVIDDDPSVLRYVSRCLVRYGFSVCAQNSGAAGVDAAIRCRPDVIVCDVTMPGMDGHEVLHRVRSVPSSRDIPFIFLTAKQERKDIRKGMQLGADDYLPKPFSIEELVDAVRSRLDRKWQVIDAASVRIREIAQRIETNERINGEGGGKQRLLDLGAFEAAMRERSETLPLVDLPVAVFRWKDADAIYQQLGIAAVEDMQGQIAERLREVAANRSEVVAIGRAGMQRLGVLFDAPASSVAGGVAQRILEDLSKPYQVGGSEVFIQFCAGYTRGKSTDVHASGSRTAAVMHEAEAALHIARSAAGSKLVVYKPEAMAVPAERRRLESDLHHSVERNQLRLHFQPQVALTTDEIASFEALVRWQHHELGMVSPAEFIPIAERNASIRPIGEWVLRESCRQMASWRRQGASLRHVAVNLSAVQMDDALPDLVRSALQDAQLEPQSLQLEITETAVLDDLQRSQRILQELRQTGVTIAIDDFGVGYSSLGYLRQLQFDVLKIDRSFVNGIEREPERFAICEMILDLAHRLRFEVVAEGVETQEAAELLASRGCRFGQGYHFSRPLPQDVVTSALWSTSRVVTSGDANCPGAVVPLTSAALAAAIQLPVKAASGPGRVLNALDARPRTA